MVGQTTQSQNHFRQRNPTPSTASPDWMLPFERGLEPHERLTSGRIKLLPRQIGERLGSVITTSRWQSASFRAHRCAAARRRLCLPLHSKCVFVFGAAESVAAALLI